MHSTGLKKRSKTWRGKISGHSNQRWSQNRGPGGQRNRFLGAGVIFVRNNLVNGLTTAAGIWATAGVGLALGADQYIVGILSAVLIIVM